MSFGIRQSVSKASCLAPLLTLWIASCGLRLPVDTVGVRPAVSPVPAASHLSILKSKASGGKVAKSPDVMVWLIADSWHTGMVFPYDWLVESGYVPPKGFVPHRYVALSWGNRDAYSKAGFDHPWKVFRVLFTPTRSVMELIPTNGEVAEVCPQQRIWRKWVARENGTGLAAFLNGCCVQDADGRPQVVTESSWGNGVQLESRYSYFIPRVCNVWTAQSIESFGGKLNPWFGLTADGLIRQLEKSPNDFEQIWAGVKRNVP